ncbi:MAG: phosphatase PAP2 family protein [Chloroflexi bacterium]|nr:phosphatase PAP2 family protein [Chloroflexota bacterium]MDA1145740.1 phosphatase PAP2 family protein [Chloroflexota bacterium]
MTALIVPLLLATVLVILAVAALRMRGSRRPAFLREVTFVLSAYFLYFVIRGVTEARESEAIARALALERLEQRLHLFYEVRLQAAVLDHSWLIELVNAVYIWGHWPVVGAVGLWLYLTRRRAYRRYRNAMLISGAVGIVIFMLFPTAPPRLANPELIDTVVERTDAYRVMQPPQLTNQFAAVPSLHLGWNLLMGIALVREAKRQWMQMFGWLMPPVMFAATIITANHYLLDAVAGAVVVLVALGIVERWGPRSRIRLPARLGGRPVRRAPTKASLGED